MGIAYTAAQGLCLSWGTYIVLMSSLRFFTSYQSNFEAYFSKTFHTTWYTPL